tara:strand:- start:155 stop:328 length:174 start_codon:yes stop_codon:yes gene_type:complete
MLKELLKKASHTFHPKFEDEFYINEIIGIEEITYDDWCENLDNGNKNEKRKKNKNGN